MMRAATAITAARASGWRLTGSWWTGRAMPEIATLAKAADCRCCPVSVACKGRSPQENRLHDTVYKAYYERMLSRLASRVGKRMMRLRAATVEPVLGSLITYYGLRQISKKRQVGAAKVMYLAAMAYNLKKYLRAAVLQQPASSAIALPLPSHLLWSFVLFCNSHVNYRTAFEGVFSVLKY
jgi:hypothetical protein